MILQTFWQNVLIVDKHTQKYTIAERSLKQSELKSFVGKFDFTEPGKYEFISKEKDPKFNAMVMKGG